MFFPHICVGLCGIELRKKSKQICSTSSLVYTECRHEPVDSPKVAPRKSLPDLKAQPAEVSNHNQSITIILSLNVIFLISTILLLQVAEEKPVAKPRKDLYKKHMRNRSNPFGSFDDLAENSAVSETPMAQNERIERTDSGWIMNLTNLLIDTDHDQ